MKCNGFPGRLETGRRAVKNTSENGSFRKTNGRYNFKAFEKEVYKMRCS